MCYGKSKEAIINVANKEDNNNMRHYGEKVIMKAGQIVSISVKELIRDLDAEEEESDYVISKFKDRSDLVDNMAKINII